MTPAKSAVALVAAKVRELLEQGSVDGASAIALVRATGDACRAAGVSKEDAADVIEAVVVEMAKGPDGVLGTADDLLNPRVLAVMQTLCRHEQVRDLAAWAAEAPRRWLPARLRSCLG